MICRADDMLPSLLVGKVPAACGYDCLANLEENIRLHPIRYQVITSNRVTKFFSINGMLLRASSAFLFLVFDNVVLLRACQGICQALPQQRCIARLQPLVEGHDEGVAVCQCPERAVLGVRRLDTQVLQGSDKADLLELHCRRILLRQEACPVSRRIPQFLLETVVCWVLPFHGMPFRLLARHGRHELPPPACAKQFWNLGS